MIYSNMYCRICGKSIPKDSRYCPYCGIEVILDETGSEQDAIIESKTEFINEDNKLIPLTAFAEKNGKMQLCKAATNNGDMIRYILFTKETRVELSPETVEFSPLEIKDHKEELVIHEYQEGEYILELANILKDNKYPH